MAGSQADVLRALGRTLDERSASKFEIMNHEMFLAISWDGAGQSDGQTSHHYMEQDLALLLEQAKEMRRGGAGGGAPGSLSELLRTLGQELDGEDVDVTAVTQQEEGFRVSGAMGGKYYQRLYFLSDLAALSAKRRAERRNWIPVPEAPSATFPALAADLAVTTSDGKRLGKVKEVRGRFFKVETGFLQRDYWLPTGIVEAVKAGTEVCLNVSAQALDEHKSHEPPAVS